MEFDGLIMFWFKFINCVCGCGVEMCLSGGFCSVDIFCKSIDVQSGSGVCINILSDVSNEGLIVVISAYSI